MVIHWVANQRKLLPAESRYRRQQTEALKPALSRQVQPVPWSAQRTSRLIILDDDKLDDEQQAARTRMLAADTQMVIIDQLARQFIQLVKDRRSHDLDQWLNDVAASGIKTLKSFANGIRGDLAAVRNALRMTWSNGQTEAKSIGLNSSSDKCMVELSLTYCANGSCISLLGIDAITQSAEEPIFA